VPVAVLDLAYVTDIDAASIGTLFDVRKLAKIRGMTLKLINLTPRVENLLELTHLRSAFEICSVAEMLNLLFRSYERSEPVNTEDETETSIAGRTREAFVITG
jgi:hypothetical protein